MARNKLTTRFFARYGPQDQILPEDLEAGKRWLVRNGAAAQMMETFAAGTFLTAYALQLGASNAIIGILAAIPYLMNVMQLFGVFLIERYRARRIVCLVAGAISRPALLLMAGAAFLGSPNAALSVLVVAFVIRYASGAIVGCSWNSWVRDLIPEKQFGRFFGERLMYMSIAGMVFGLAAAGFVDYWKSADFAAERFAYPLLLTAAFVSGAFGVYCMSRVAEPRIDIETGGQSLFSRLSQPLRDGNFRRLIIFLMTWNFAVNLAAPFFTVYMLTRLGLDLLTVILLTTLSQIGNIVIMRQWGQLVDRFSNKSVLQVCGPLFILCIFAWTFTTFPERHSLTIPLLVLIHLLAGIATAGVTLASSNIALKLAPRGRATAYLATNSLAVSFAAGSAPIFGGLFADFFINRELSLTINWTSPGGNLAISPLNITHWDFFFLVAVVVGLYVSMSF